MSAAAMSAGAARGDWQAKRDQAFEEMVATLAYLREMLRAERQSVARAAVARDQRLLHLEERCFRALVCATGKAAAPWPEPAAQPSKIVGKLLAGAKEPA